MALYQPATCSRSDVAAMLSALPFEEKKSVLNYQAGILAVPPVTDEEKPKKKTNGFFAEFRGLPADNTPDEVLCLVHAMSFIDYHVPADEDGRGAIADFESRGRIDSLHSRLFTENGHYIRPSYLRLRRHAQPRVHLPRRRIGD